MLECVKPKIVGGSEAYERPSDWLDLTHPTDGEEKVVGLYAVYDTDTNFCAIKCRGAYTVDWGDGSAPENVADSVTAEHNYDYADLGAETECSRGYRQAIITITPQGGSNLTQINFDERHSSDNQTYRNCWLDIAVAGSNITNCKFYQGNSSNSGMLEIFAFVGTCIITDFSYMFYKSYTLQSISLSDTGSGTDFSYMFYQCFSLPTIPELDVSLGTNFTNMFYQCHSLRSVPELNTPLGTNFANMFYQCTSLQEVTLPDTGSGTDFTSMFYYCTSLQEVTLPDTGSGTNFTSMFERSHALQVIPELDVSSGTNFTKMFYICWTLQVIPELDVSSGTNFANIFQNCSSLKQGAFAEETLSVDCSYLNCQMARAELNDVITGCCDFEETITIDVAPATDWEVDDVITGQTSGESCVVVAKLTDFTYTVKTRTGTFTLGEIIGVTGNADKLADQGAAHPTFAGRGSATLTLTGNWGTADLTADDKKALTNKGWTGVY